MNASFTDAKTKPVQRGLWVTAPGSIGQWVSGEPGQRRAKVGGDLAWRLKNSRPQCVANTAPGRRQEKERLRNESVRPEEPEGPGWQRAHQDVAGGAPEGWAPLMGCIEEGAEIRRPWAGPRGRFGIFGAS